MRQRGDMLIEAIIGMAVAVVVITAIVLVVNGSLNNTNSIESKVNTAKLTQEGMDIIRGKKEDGYAAFKTNYPTGIYCINKDDTITSIGSFNPDLCTNNDGVNIRLAYLNHTGKNLLNQQVCGTNPASTYVAVAVFWNDSKCKDDSFCHDTQIESCMTDLNSVPAL